MLTQSRLKELLRYDPETGLFTRLKTVAYRAKVGDVAGSKDSNGYWRISVDGHRYKSHRLAWLYMTGRWPANEIDHKYGDNGDNRWENLREATRKINNQNQRRPRRNSTTGFLGVSRFGRRFRATIVVNNKQKSLGLFDSPAIAHAAYLIAKKRFHEGCTI